MTEDLLSQLDSIYARYGYEPHKNHKAARVYLFTKSIYSGADLIRLGTDEELDSLKKQYSELGYAVKIRNYNTLAEAEDVLFKDFFKADGVLNNLSRKYNLFIERVMDNLPDGATYEYIKSSYDFTLFKTEGETISLTVPTSAEDSNGLIKRVVNLIGDYKGPVFTIVEAAAGYGKTCTAYEILKELINDSNNKIPFFTELSRDRRATIFKHILQNEIEEQFANRVDSNVVIHEIKQGRIPLIIDGFDELISKDFSFSTNQFEQVESMLSTIVDLLTDNAKIIITSRKTAIFNSEEFHNWMLDRNLNYTLAKFTINEPSIENWLNKERLDILSVGNFPMEQMSNPVLLTYLRYVDVESLEQMAIQNISIVDRYFNFLLTREQTRQNLLLEPDSQLKIFGKIVRIMTELDIKSESKDFIKELILDFNKDLIEETRKKYTPDQRPRADQLADTLSNHAFLDRKEKNQIGFVNEFIFGTLIGLSLINGDYLKHNENFHNELSQIFSLLAVQAFQVQPPENKERLWEIFNSFDFHYDPQFFFKTDLDFKKRIIRNFDQAVVEGFHINKIDFSQPKQFKGTVFTDCVFTECCFHLECFQNSSFVSCKFFGCKLIEKEGLSYSDQYFTLYGCVDNNNFINKIFQYDNKEKAVDINLEKEILSLYFKKGGLIPRHRQLSHVKSELENFSSKLISDVLHKLKKDDILVINGDLSFLSRNGISYFNDTYRN